MPPALLAILASESPIWVNEFPTDSITPLIPSNTVLMASPTLLNTFATPSRAVLIAVPKLSTTRAEGLFATLDRCLEPLYL